MQEEVNEDSIKEIFRKHGFHVTPTNVRSNVGLFCSEWGDFVEDYSQDSRYGQYLISMFTKKEGEYQSLTMKFVEASVLIFKSLAELDTSLGEDRESEYDYMSFNYLYKIENGYLLRACIGSSKYLFDGEYQPWANPSKYKNEI